MKDAQRHTRPTTRIAPFLPDAHTMIKTSTARLLAVCTAGLLATGCVTTQDNGYYDPAPIYPSGGVYGPGGYPQAYPQAYPVYPSQSPQLRNDDDRRRWQQERERERVREARERERERDRANNQRDREREARERDRDAREREARQRDQQYNREQQQRREQQEREQQLRREQQAQREREQARQNHSGQDRAPRWRSPEELERNQGR